MKQYDIQLAILSIAGFIVFGMSLDPMRISQPSDTSSPEVMGAFSGDRTGCKDQAVPLTRGPLEVRTQDGVCTDVELLISMPEKDLSVFDRQVTYRMTVTNHGPDTAHGLEVRSVLPKSFLPVEVSGDILLGSYSKTHDFYFIPRLEPYTTTFIDVTAEIGPIACGYTHMATGFVSVSGGFDTYRANNRDTQTLSVPHCPKWEQLAMP